MSKRQWKIASLAAVAFNLVSACGPSQPSSQVAAVTPPGISRDEIISYALTGIGSKYIWGGTQWNPDNRAWKGADCSGYVAKAWAIPTLMSPQEFTPHAFTTAEFRNDRQLWKDVDKANGLLPGDALVYRKNGAGHIVIFNAYTADGGYKTLEARGKDYGIVKHKRTKAASKLYVGIRRKGIGAATDSNDNMPNTGDVTPDDENSGESGDDSSDNANSGDSMSDNPSTIPFAANVKCENVKWKTAWNEIVAEGLDAYGARLMSGEMARADIEGLCPNYFSATQDQKKAFWALVFASMSCNESLNNPNANVSGSIGLLSLSYSDKTAHPRCELSSTTKNAKDPRANLRCGIAVLDDEIERTSGLVKNNIYWTSLRPNKRADKTKAAFMKFRDSLGFCGN